MEIRENCIKIQRYGGCLVRWKMLTGTTHTQILRQELTVSYLKSTATITGQASKISPWYLDTALNTVSSLCCRTFHFRCNLFSPCRYLAVAKRLYICPSKNKVLCCLFEDCSESESLGIQQDWSSCEKGPYFLCIGPAARDDGVANCEGGEDETKKDDPGSRKFTLNAVLHFMFQRIQSWEILNNSSIIYHLKTHN